MSGARPHKDLYYGWFVLGACFFALFLSVGARNGFGVFIIPMSEELGWSRGTISLAIAIGWLVNGLTQPFIGRLYDRYGGRKVISIGLLVLGSSTMLLSQTNNLWFLILVFGFIMSIASGASTLVTIHALLAKWFYRKRGAVLSIGAAGGSAGSLVLVPFAAYLILLSDWRVAWLVIGAMILLLALPLSLLLIRDDPAELGLLPDGDEEGPGAAPSKPSFIGRRGPLESESWRDSFRSPPIWQMTGAYFVCGITTAIISAHYVPFAISRGASPGTAALAFGLMGGLTLTGVLIVGLISDKMDRKTLLASVYAVRGLGYAMLILAPGMIGIWGFAVIAGLGWVASVPLTSSLTADIYGLKNLGTLNGMATLMHQIGGAMSIYLGGVLYDIFGAYDVPFAIAGVTLVGASLVSLSIREKKYSVRYQQATTAPAGMAAGHGA